MASLNTQEDDDMPKSPVPLSREEAANAEVVKLAAKLGPILEETDALFAVPQEFQRQTTLESAASNENDNLDLEIESLEVSEQLLRQELELAQDFSSLFALEHDQQDDDEEDDPRKQLLFTSPSTESKSSAEADLEPDDDTASPAEAEAGLPPIRIPTPPSPGSTPKNRSRSRSDDSTSYLANSYSLRDHFGTLRMQTEERGGWYSVDMSRFFLDDESPIKAVKEYCLAIPDAKLKTLFVGLPDQPQQAAAATAIPLPVRTIVIRIRPDVLCGAVLDAVHHSLQGMQARILKRQGGHCRAVVPGAVYSRGQNDNTGESDDTADESKVESSPMSTIRYPPFLVDAQLCTYKSPDCERVLLIRIYHLEDGSDEGDNDVVTEDLVHLQSPPHNTSSAAAEEEYLLVSHHTSLTEPVDEAASKHLKESCALMQRMESPVKARRIRSPSLTSPSSPDPSSVPEAVSAHLLDNYRACPSSREGNITVPALNSDDWSLVLSSWRWITTVWSELETRDLTYTTLATARVGAFPALPTLDVHYCSQIRRLSREAMIVQLLKSASELEEYAREAEFKCANMIALLQPTFEAYGMKAPSLPKPVPLTAYPLDFVAPQVSCPPWGVKVMEALNEIQAWTGDAGKDDTATDLSSAPAVNAEQSLDMAQSAVQLVLDAFHKQDDEEQSARLGRKNVQVMDRLSKMQAHQRASIHTLQNSSRLSERAAKAAADFLSKSGVREVPLLKWSIVVGGSTGTCWVTANHILFVTQLIPIVGGRTTTLYSLNDVEFALEEATPSLLNPLPTVVNVLQNGEPVYSFRPSTGGSRLKSFLDIVKGVATMETPPLDVPDDKPPVLDMLQQNVT